VATIDYAFPPQFYLLHRQTPLEILFPGGIVVRRKRNFIATLNPLQSHLMITTSEPEITIASKCHLPIQFPIFQIKDHGILP
jgi:hypothetical protein